MQVLQPDHLQEWVQNSAVSESITQRNLTSLSNNGQIAQMLGWAQYPGGPGWWVGSLNPTTGKTRDKSGQFKPNVPVKLGAEKPAKYLSPKGDLQAIFLAMDTEAFWPSIIADPTQPVILTEGAKKAGTGLTCGYATIALTGVWNWVETVGHKTTIRRLIADIQLFAQVGRPFVLAFDSDIGVKVLVQTALASLAEELSHLGCYVYVLQWPQIYKGLDDWVVAKGAAALHDAMHAKQPFAEWKHQSQTLQSQRTRTQLRQELEGITHHDTEVDRHLRRLTIAKEYGLRVSDLNTLEQSIKQDIDRADTQTQLKTDLDLWLQTERHVFRIQDYLCPELAEPLTQLSTLMQAPEAAFMTTLLPIAGSLLRPGTLIQITQQGFEVPPILFSAIVAESGSMKSPIQNLLMKPIFDWQQQEKLLNDKQRQTYELELQAWKRNKDADTLPPKEPFPRHFYVHDATRESWVDRMQQNPDRGIFIYTDELAALIKSRGEYKTSQHSDFEALMSAYDGTPIKVDRASGKFIYIRHPQFGITGSIQPAILEQMMGDFSDPNGHWSRYIWFHYPLQPSYLSIDDNPLNLTPLLRYVYTNLEAVAARVYTLKGEVRETYIRWTWELEQRRSDSANPMPLRAMYAKMKGATARFALLLHCLNAAAVGQPPAASLDLATVKQAIRLAKFYIGQVRMWHNRGRQEESPHLVLLKEIMDLSAKKGWLTARQVKHHLRRARKLENHQLRRLFEDLAAMGYGQTQGQGERLQWLGDTPVSDAGPPAVESVLEAGSVKAGKGGSVRAGLRPAPTSPDNTSPDNDSKPPLSDAWLKRDLVSPTPLDPAQDLTLRELTRVLFVQSYPPDQVQQMLHTYTPSQRALIQTNLHPFDQVRLGSLV